MKKILRLFSGYIISLCYLTTGYAQERVINDFINTPGLESATVGISCLDLKTGKTVINYNDNLTMVPASTIKILTTATAIDLMGKDASIITRVGYTGDVRDGVLNGNLVIKGYGDPSLGSERFGEKDFIEIIRKNLLSNNIRYINGDIVADISFMPSEPASPAWIWEDLGNYYAPGIHSINYKDNTYRLILDTSKKNVRPKVIKTDPYIPGLEIVNNLLPYNPGFDSAFIYGIPFDNKRYVFGAVNQSKNTFTVKGDIPDPGLFLAYSVFDDLSKTGFIGKSSKYYTVNKEMECRTLFTYESPSIGQLCKVINNHSDNLYAESLFRYTGAKAGNTRHVSHTITFVKDYWSNKGLDTKTLFIYDGCGLAPSNRINPTFYTSLLFYMKDNKSFVLSLPVAGKEGTVRNFLKGNGFDNRFRLKSGSIKQVVAYVGYVSANQNSADLKQDYAIAIMINNHTCGNAQLRKAIEKMIAGLNL